MRYILLTKFQAYDRELLTAGTTLFSRSLELIHFETLKLYPSDSASKLTHVVISRSQLLEGYWLETSVLHPMDCLTSSLCVLST